MKTFNYASTSAVKENLTYLILGAALIVFPLVHPFGIRIGAKPVLGPLPTTILLIIAGLYMLYTAYRKIRQARALSARSRRRRSPSPRFRTSRTTRRTAS